VALGTKRRSFFWRFLTGRKVVKGGVRSVIEGFFREFLKERFKDFDRYMFTKVAREHK